MRSLFGICVLFFVASIAFVAPALADEPEKKITLTIDFSDGSELRFTRIAWKEGMTVQDAMRQIERHPRGVRTMHRGEGETAFLTQIADVKNEGARGRNWIYRVNGKVADRSYAVQALKVRDEVLWQFSDTNDAFR